MVFSPSERKFFKGVEGIILGQKHNELTVVTKFQLKDSLTGHVPNVL